MPPLTPLPSRGRPWQRGFALLVGGFALLAACGGPRLPPATPRAETPERAFLLDPAADSGLPTDSAVRRRLEAAHTRLIANADAVGALAAVQDLLAEQPDLAAAKVLAAQAELVAGRYVEARLRVAAVTFAEPRNVSALLVLGRAADRLGDVVAAFAVYRSVAIPVAAERAAALEKPALAAADQALRAALARGNLPDAEAALLQLREFAPTSTLALRGERAVAAAKQDRGRELAAVRRLVALDPDSLELVERQALLEVEAGDASVGVAIFQRLVERRPQDRRLLAFLDWAKFQWRLQLLPQAVRRVANRPQLDRAELATLLYWLGPGVRRGRSGAARIASDVLDHPHREEIVRVVNLGLLELDETLHQFAPERTATRGETLRALVLLILDRRPSSPCLGGVVSAQRLTREAACDAASACGLLPAPEDCVGAAPVSGAEAVEWIRLASGALGETAGEGLGEVKP